MRDWNKEPGELLFRRHYDPKENPIEILRADPVVLVCRELLEEVTLVDSPWVKLDGIEFIHFIGRNRTVIYRIGEYDFLSKRYTLRWPD